MDPLSITASAITLVAAANTITTSLCRLAHNLRTADSRVTGLCDELANLTGFLEAVERTLKGCRSLDLACADEDLWRQSELALTDCQVTLNELGVLVNKIKENAREKGFGWRARSVVDFNRYGADIATCRDKIHKSNWALQTMLHTITVSLSLRNNLSQDLVLFELDRLKSSIDEALRVSLRPAGGLHHGLSSDTRVARNLRNLAQAAKQFHSAASSAASSTASTTRGESIAHWRSERTDTIGPMSLVGDLPAFKRERVEMFLRDAHQQSPGHETPVRSASPVLDPALIHSHQLPAIARLHRLAIPESVAPSKIQTVFENDEDDDDEAEFERQFLDGLEDLAKDSIRIKDFDKAVQLLQEAIKREQGSSDSSGGFHRLQLQLALCYLFQGNWKLAEPIVCNLAKFKGSPDLVVCSLLHAVALAYLSSYSFDNATKLCKQALQGKKKWAKSKGLRWQDDWDYAETLGLLATISQMTGDYIAAEIYRRQLPEGFAYQHPANGLQFFAGHRTLLAEVLGSDVPDMEEWESADDTTLCELEDTTGSGLEPLGWDSEPDQSYQVARNSSLHRNQTVNNGDTSPLRTRRHHWERLENDTGKEVVLSAPTTRPTTSDTADADDEASTAPTSPLQRRLTRMFGARKTRHRRRVADYHVEVTRKPSTSSPIKKWFKGFGAQMKSTWKPPTEEISGPRSFRLLRETPPYRHFGYDSYDAVNSMPRGQKDTCDFFFSPQVQPAELGGGGYYAPSDNFTSRNGVAYIATWRPRSRERATSAGETDKADCPPVIAELSAGWETQPHDPKPISDAPIRDFLSMYSLLSVAEVANGNAYPKAMTFLAIPRNNEVEPTALEARSATIRGIHTPEEESSRKLHPANSARGNTMKGQQKLTLITSTLPSQPSTPCELDTTLAHLAEILVSLPAGDNKDAKKVDATKLRLEVISQKLRLMSNDITLRLDVQRIITSLAERKARILEEQNDSGYESMSQDVASTESEPDSPSSDTPSCPTKDAVVVEGDMPASTLQKTASETKKTVLSRTFSWIKGSEALYTSVTPRLERSSSPVNKAVPVIRSPKKYVKWAPESG